MLRLGPEMSNVPELDQSNDPVIPTEPVAPITSRFLFVDVAALRAKQLRRGARLRIQNAEEHLPKKAERLAMEEVKRGLVAYDVPARKVQGADAAEDEA